MCHFIGGLFKITDIAVLLTILVICSASDLRYRRVKDRYILAGIIIKIFLLIVLKESQYEFFFNLAMTFVLTALIVTVVTVFRKILKKQLIGGADIKLIFMCGMYIAFDRYIYMLLCAFLLALAAGIYLKIKKRNNVRLPFVPFLLIGVVLVLLPSAVEGDYLTCQIIRGF